MTENALSNSLSVIIPTYNRRDVLVKALGGYQAQTSPELIREILIVDDGSTDDTESMVEEFSRGSVFPIRYLRQSNKGPAAARNFGIREAKSSLLLFSDSDIIPAHDLVEQHVVWHQKTTGSNVAVLGYVTWPLNIKVTPFMRWYGEEGVLFQFRSLRGKTVVDDFHFFYTCNLSLKTDFVRSAGGFDEEFKSAAYEDTELGYRLSKRGLQLLYNPAAIAYHHQFFSFHDACRKLRANDSAARLFLQKEAGQRTTEVPKRKFRTARAITKKFILGIAKALLPSRGLLDSNLPLPGIVYDVLLKHDAASLVVLSGEQAPVRQ